MVGQTLLLRRVAESSTARPSQGGTRVLTLAVVLALGFCAVDSAARLRAIWTVTDIRVLGAPAIEEDRASFSGYLANQHQLIVPNIGADGYHWIMQTERMVAGTEGWRVRHVDYDHPPDGRGVEWGGFLRWQLAGTAWLASRVTAVALAPDSWIGRSRDMMFGPYRPGGLPINQAIERVAPWTNTVTLMLVVLIVVPVIAWRVGAVPGALLALGFVTIYPLYESFSVGYLDHHGLAATWGLFTVLFLIAGGAGWLRTERTDVAALPPAEQRLWRWLPHRGQARRWFVASALAGSCGLWESASSEAPVLVAVGVGVLISVAWLNRAAAEGGRWEFDPALWRTWGVVGAGASLFFYLLEYFPHHFGWNLQINHPLYAVAWLGAGDLLCRVCEWRLRGAPGALVRIRGRAAWLLAADVAMVAALPVTIALTAPATFVTADPFLWQLCRDYIFENQPLLGQIARLDVSAMLGRMTGVGLLLVPIGMTAMLLLRGARSVSGATLPSPWNALLSLVLLPSLVLVGLALQQARWLALGCALWLATLVVIALVSSDSWSLQGRLRAGAFLLLLFGPFPVYSMTQWTHTGSSPAVTQLDLAQVVTRDAAYRLRQRLGTEPGVIVSGPSSTTLMTYFGGFKGLGTLYSDNLDGLKAVAEIYSTSSPQVALELCRKYGVTHVAIFSWDAFAQEYPRLWYRLRRTERVPEDAFIPRLLKTGSIPIWLRPIPYAIPPDAELATQYVRIFEVVPDQSEAEAVVRVAQYLLANRKPADAVRQLRPLVTRTPDDLAALVCLARAQHALGDMTQFHRVLQQVRAHLAAAGAMRFEDRVNLALLLNAANDGATARAQLEAALQQADEHGIRHLLPDTLVSLVGLMRQTDLAGTYARVHRWAFDLLPPEAEALFIHG